MLAPNMTLNLIPFEDMDIPGTHVHHLQRAFGCQAGGPMLTSTGYTTNTTVSNAFKIYFWGNYFLNMWNTLEIFREKCV